MSSDVSKLRKFVPQMISYSSKFLSYMFYCNGIKNISYVHSAYLDLELIDEFFFSLTILNGSLFPFLNEFFFNNNNTDKGV